jgi:hypothetical protein
MDLPDGFFYVTGGIAHPINPYWCQHEYSTCPSEKLKSIIHFLTIAAYLSGLKEALDRNVVKVTNFKEYVDIRYGLSNKYTFDSFLRDLPLRAFLEACRLGKRLLRDPLLEEVIDIVIALLLSTQHDDVGKRVDDIKRLVPEDLRDKIDIESMYHRPLRGDADHDDRYTR